MKLIKHFGKKEEGSVLVVGIFSITTMLAFLGLALDVGNLVYTKTLMQNAVDAAACAGSLALPSTDTATTTATTFLHNNGFTSVTPTVTFTQDTTHNPSDLPEINVSMSQNVSTLVMGVLGITSVPLSAKAEAVQISSSGSGGPFGYTLFSGDPTWTLTINGGNTVGGSVHSNGSLILNGSVSVSGNAEGGKGVIANGQVAVGGAISADTLSDITTNGNVTYGSETAGASSSISMPDFSSLVSGIPGIQTITPSGGTQIYNNTAPSSSIFVNGNVILNGSISGIAGAIVATGNITVNGCVTLNSGNQVCLYSENGNIIINGCTTFSSSADNSIVYAPNGSITFNGSNNPYNGKLIAKRLTINGAATFNGNYAFTAIPGASSKHAKLVN